MNNIEKYFDKIAVRYQEADTGLEQLFWRKLDLKLIQAYLPKRKNHYIDFGCGAGFYAKEVYPFFKESFLIDASSKMLTIAKTTLKRAPRKSVTFIHAQFQDTYFEEGSISFILATGSSICYGENSLRLILKKAHKLLENGGRFYFEVWNTPGLLIAASHYNTPFFDLTNSINNMRNKNVKQFLQTGLILENSYICATMAKSYSFETVLTNIQKIGFRLVAYYGRKAITLLLRQTNLLKLIHQYPKKVAEMEYILNQRPEIILVCPKVIFILEKINI